MFWILRYTVVSDFLARREPLLLAHRSLAESSQRLGFLVMSGIVEHPDAESGGAIDGEVFVFKAHDRAIAEQFVQDDAYVQQGLVTQWSISRWNVDIEPTSNLGFGQSRSGIWDR